MQPYYKSHLELKKRHSKESLPAYADLNKIRLTSNFSLFPVCFPSTGSGWSVR